MSQFSSLRRALTDTEPLAIDDMVLAEIASAEVAGEDVDTLYAAEMRQIEASVPLAETYAELMTMMETAVAHMSLAAVAVSPEDAYARLLQSQLHAPTELQPALRQAADQLARRCHTLPASAADLPDPLLNAATAPLPASWQAKLADAIRQNIAALALYLQGRADALWQQTLAVTADTTSGMMALQLTPALHTIPLLSGTEMGETRTLFNQRLGRPLPQNITVQVQRIDALRCRLTVQHTHPGQRQPAGQPVQIRYGDVPDTAVPILHESGPIYAIPSGNTVQETAVTDPTATATFTIPISALDSLTISLPK
ncbi:MAG: hypothetical protein H6662_06200 [Ardenticatenaceae bacterium]|nr:hypothetical protein [Anaerolineales bacterium]MCB8921158.1 hypothetical protein [Ardenticatenaceae bacterium]MCB9004443.1 hypothetical protein [Ardenticatenaceae bacterium]